MQLIVTHLPIGENAASIGQSGMEILDALRQKKHQPISHPRKHELPAPIRPLSFVSKGVSSDERSMKQNGPNASTSAPSATRIGVLPYSVLSCRAHICCGPAMR